MPRTADHVLRRQQVAGALLRVIVRGGLAEASLAAVAQEAGVSVGLIQRYFSTKDELLAFAFAHLLDRVDERLTAAAPTSAEPVRDTAYRLLEKMLPLDEERFAESVVWVAFLAGTLPDPAAIAPHVTGMRRMHQLLTAAGMATAEAVLLTSVVDGLILDMVTNPADVTPDVGRACLRLAVDRAFGSAS
ncbi:MAG: TetR/AcrR family transcriptional regulator [Pseudonocardiaceae bacterium]|nr:TetR/AcrR family transcriptional regulator [Pseudonocardiaceae bacterium]